MAFESVAKLAVCVLERRGLSPRCALRRFPVRSGRGRAEEYRWVRSIGSGRGTMPSPDRILCHLIHRFRIRRYRASFAPPLGRGGQASASSPPSSTICRAICDQEYFLVTAGSRHHHRSVALSRSAGDLGQPPPSPIRISTARSRRSPPSSTYVICWRGDVQRLAGRVLGQRAVDRRRYRTSRLGRTVRARPSGIIPASGQEEIIARVVGSLPGRLREIEGQRAMHKDRWRSAPTRPICAAPSLFHQT